MNAPTNVRLMEENGVKYAVLPYDDYLALSRFELVKQTRGIPHQIVGEVMPNIRRSCAAAILSHGFNFFIKF